MTTLLHDIRFGLRTLVKQPGFTLVVAVTLALGIGANTAIFGIVNGVLLRPLPYPEPDRVVMLWSHWINWRKTWLSQAELSDYQTAKSLEHVAAFQYTSLNLTGGGEPQRVVAAQVEPDVFAALGAQPVAGRVFGPDENQPGREHVAVLGEGLWRSQFGSDPTILGRTISLDGTPYTVLGVLPALLRLPIDYARRTPPALWIPIALGPANQQQRGNHGLFAIARLRPGATLAGAQAEIDTIVDRFKRTYSGNYDKEFGLTLVPAPDEVFGGVRLALIVLLGAVAAVLLIACANVANLLLARSEARQKEIAIRTVLGVGRGRLVRQLVTEALLLAGIGALAGIGLAYTLIRLLVALDPLKIPRLHDVAIDGRVLLFTAALTLVTGVLFGMAPALHAVRANLQGALKEGGRDSRVSTGWLRQTLVVVQIAASVALVVAAVLLARSFARLLGVDSGFKAAHVLTLRTSLPDTRYANGSSMARAYGAVGAALREMPGAEAVGGVSGLPLASTRGDWGIRIEGRPITGKLQLAADWQVVTPGYFEAMGVPVIAGRTFTDADQANTMPVIVINDTMAKRFWPAENPLGRRLTMGGNNQWLTVIGIVGNVRHGGLDAEPRTEMYRPHAQFRFGGPEPNAVPTLTWTIRTHGDPAAATSFARAAIRRVDPDLGVSDVETMEQVVADSTSDRRLNLWLFALLGGLALALATVGVYGVVAYSVTERTHEFGVRMAIGAQAGDVLGMVLAQGFRLAVMGVALGTGAAFLSTQMIRGLLFQVSPGDPATFAYVAIVLTAVALMASYVPARRATRVDPMVALRGE